MGDDECKIHLDAMREVYMLVVLNLKMLHDRYPPPMGNLLNDELKKGDLVLIKNQTLQSPFSARYEPSYRIIKKIGDKSYHVQDPTGKVKRVTARILQFMYPAEYYVAALLQIQMCGRTVKFINHPCLMPDLYKDLDDDRHTSVDKQTVSAKSTRCVARVIHHQHLTVSTCDPMVEMLYM